MTSDNVTEVEPVRAAEPQPAEKVDDQLIDELVGRAQAEGLQLTGKGAGPLDPALEDRAERLRHHLRRPPLRSSSVTPTTLVTPPFDRPLMITSTVSAPQARPASAQGMLGLPPLRL